MRNSWMRSHPYCGEGWGTGIPTGLLPRLAFSRTPLGFNPGKRAHRAIQGVVDIPPICPGRLARNHCFIQRHRDSAPVDDGLGYYRPGAPRIRLPGSLVHFQIRGAENPFVSSRTV